MASQPPPPPSHPNAPPSNWQQPPAYPGQVPTPYYGTAGQPSNGVGLAGGIVGIVAACLLWVPYVGGVLGIIGVVLGSVGLQRANRMGGTSKGMSIAGIVCGAVALVVNVLFIIAIYSSVHSIRAYGT